MNKKAQSQGLAGLASAVIILIIAAISLFLGLQLLTGFQDASSQYTTTVVNESGFINSSGYTFSTGTLPGFKNLNIISATNATTGALIQPANYTTGNISMVYNASAKLWNLVNFTYSYQYGQEAYKSANKTVTGAASFSDYWQLIVLAVVISVVIGLILLVMSQRKIK